MAIHKGPVREQFTQIPNATHRDTSISLQARGLLGYLLSLPDDWVVRPQQLAEDNGIGRNTAYKIIGELREAGYIIQVQGRDKSGQFASGDYLVFRSVEDATWYAETRMDTDVEPCVKKGDAEKRHTEKRQLTKKDNKNKESKSVNNARASNFSVDQIIVDLHELGMPKKETWYARKKAQEFIDRWPQSESMADACRYVTNAIDHAWKLEGKSG